MKTWKDVVANEAKKGNQPKEPLGNVPRLEQTDVDKQTQSMLGTVKELQKQVDADKEKIAAQQKIIQEQTKERIKQKKKRNKEEKKLRKSLKKQEAAEKLVNYRFQVIDFESVFYVDSEKLECTRYAADIINRHIDEANQYIYGELELENVPDMPSPDEVVEAVFEKHPKYSFFPPLFYEPETLEEFKDERIDMEVVQYMIEELNNQIDEYTTLVEAVDYE